jgi:hypothetical protein
MFKGQWHEIVCQLRPFVYCLGLTNSARISFTLVKSRVAKDTMLQKVGLYRCKMVWSGFHSIVKSRAQIFKAVIADGGAGRLNLTADCHWF